MARWHKPLITLTINLLHVCATRAMAQTRTTHLNFTSHNVKDHLRSALTPTQSSSILLASAKPMADAKFYRIFSMVPSHILQLHL